MIRERLKALIDQPTWAGLGLLLIAVLAIALFELWVGALVSWANRALVQWLGPWLPSFFEVVASVSVSLVIAALVVVAAWLGGYLQAFVTLGVRVPGSEPEEETNQIQMTHDEIREEVLSWAKAADAVVAVDAACRPSTRTSGLLDRERREDEFQRNLSPAMRTRLREACERAVELGATSYHNVRGAAGGNRGATVMAAGELRHAARRMARRVGLNADELVPLEPRSDPTPG